MAHQSFIVFIIYFHISCSLGNNLWRRYKYSNCQIIISTCFRRCQDIAVGLYLIFCFLSRYLEILRKSRTACLDHQAKESAVKCLSQGQNNVSSFRTATVSIAFAINQSAFTQSITLLTFYNEYEITQRVGKIFQT